MSPRLALRLIVAALAGLIVGAASLSPAAVPSPSPTQEIGYVDFGGHDGSGIDGEAEAVICPDCVTLNSYDFLVTKPAPSDPVFKRLEITVPIDSASPRLLDSLANASPILDVTISLTRAGAGETFVWKTFLLSNAKVTSMREYASGHGNDSPKLVLTLSFTKIVVEYTQQDPDTGEALGRFTFCWNLQTDAECGG